MNQEQIKLNIAIQPDFNCPKCGSFYFHQVLRMKIVPGLLVGAKTTQLMPVPVFTCAKCNYEFHHEDADIQLKQKSVGHPALVVLQSGGVG